MSAQPQHMVQLDGLRAFAVGSVMVAHYGFGSELTQRIDFGPYGVWLFFVLSGFLITGILLRCRRRIEAGAVSGTFVLRRFYARRFLRIFPIYYLTVVVISLGSEPIREQVLWLLGYVQNVKVTLDGQFGPAPHFWSLAVEEQFYVVWPALILFLPRRALPALLLGLVAVAPTWRALVLVGWDGTSISARVFTLGCLDTLALGGLLALARDPVSGSPAWAKRLGQAGLWLGLPLALSGAVLHALGGAEALEVVAGDLGWGLLFVWLIGRASSGFEGLPGRILSHRVAVYLGRISYGLYVYHLFIPPLLKRAAARWELSWLEGPLLIGLAVVIAVSLAAASWQWFERPINALKRHVPYEPAQQAA